MAAGSSSRRLHAAARSVLLHNATTGNLTSSSSVAPSSTTAAAITTLACSSSKGKQRQPAASSYQNLTLSTTSTTTTRKLASGQDRASSLCSACGSPRHAAAASFSTSATSSSSSPTSMPSASSSSAAAYSAAAPPMTSTSTSRSALIRPVRIVPPRQSIPAVTASTDKKPKTHSAPARPSSVDARTAEVSKMYALQAVPPPTALAALANRISSRLLGDDSSFLSSSSSSASSTSSSSNKTTRDEWLKQIERCCTCPSFWSVVREEQRQEEIRHFQKEQSRRAMGHQGDIAEQEEAAASLPSAPKQFTNYLDAERLDNSELATLGNHLLGVFAIEWLDARYPRLPTNALKAALTLYVGPRTCADIASREWGILSGQAAKQAFLGQTSHFAPGQPLRGVGEGSRAGVGLLRWGKPSDSDLKKIVSQQRNPTVKEREESDHRTPLPLEEALASAARAFVGLILQEHGFIAARQFVHSNFLSRSADIASLLKFTNPKYTLSSTVSKQGLPSPTTRILAETGRLSIAPIFVLGVYSGTLKLGEGYGSSLAMAEYRACEDALRRVYLSSEEKFADIFTPVNAARAGRKSHLVAPPSLARVGEQDVAKGLPSDAIVQPDAPFKAQRPLYDDETLYQSSR